jgi:hypothetical protein
MPNTVWHATGCKPAESGQLRRAVFDGKEGDEGKPADRSAGAEMSAQKK